MAWRSAALISFIAISGACSVAGAAEPVIQVLSFELKTLQATEKNYGTTVKIRTVGKVASQSIPCGTPEQWTTDQPPHSCSFVVKIPLSKCSGTTVEFETKGATDDWSYVVDGRAHVGGIGQDFPFFNDTFANPGQDPDHTVTGIVLPCQDIKNYIDNGRKKAEAARGSEK